ncbi:MAG: type II toxin-antitoxin system RelE/ParE family toxin [Bacteroidia bacterium]
MYSVTIHAEAEKHLAKYYLYYEERLLGLGDEFISSVEKCIHYIQKNPVSNEVKYKNFRMAMIDRFPYGVFYLVNQKQKIILIAAVFFLKISPKTIKGGLRKI